MNIFYDIGPTILKNKLTLNKTNKNIKYIIIIIIIIIMFAIDKHY